MKAILEKLDDVPEAIRGEYAEKDGKYVLKVEDAEEAFAAGLKRTNQEVLKENKKLKEQIRSYEGIDPEKAREVLAREETAAAEAARLKGDWETRERQLVEKYRSEIGKRDNVLAAKDATIGRLLIESEAISAIKNLKAFPAAEEAMLPVIRALTKVVANEKGEYIAQVLDRPSGAERIAEGGSQMTIPQLVAELAEREPWNHLFPAKDTAGSGAPSAHIAGGNGLSSKSRDKMSVSEKVAFIEKHGHDAFLKLPA